MKIAYNAYWFFVLSLLIFVYFFIFFFLHFFFLLLPFLVNKRCIFLIMVRIWLAFFFHSSGGNEKKMSEGAHPGEKCVLQPLLSRRARDDVERGFNCILFEQFYLPENQGLRYVRLPLHYLLPGE